MRNVSFQSATGVKRTLCIWAGDKPVRGVVHIVHGMAEHVARYGRMAEQLNDAGFVVAGFDLPGHGPDTPRESLGFFADKEGWPKLREDVHQVRGMLMDMYPGAPYILMGHSMGSFLSRNYLQHVGKSAPPSGLILSGTGQYGAGLCFAGRMLASFVCLMGGSKKPSEIINNIAFSANNKPFEPARTPFDWLSRDAAEVDKYIADPYCGFVFTTSGFRDFFGGLMELATKDQLSGLPNTMPVLMISGDQDPVGGMGKGVQQVKDAFDKAGFQDITMHLYAQGRHEMLNEVNRDEVTQHILKWLTAHFA